MNPIYLNMVYYIHIVWKSGGTRPRAPTYLRHVGKYPGLNMQVP